MTPFTVLTGIAAVLPQANLDTDQILPKQFLKTVDRTGLGEALFYDMRYDENGEKYPDFILNRPEFDTSSILISGHNFGCGSSREHAPWALRDFGIRCVIAPSFADIFYHNCISNGLLPVRLDEGSTAALMALCSDRPTQLTVDLRSGTITSPDGFSRGFTIEDRYRERLLNGLDSIGLTLVSLPEIEAFEAARAT